MPRSGFLLSWSGSGLSVCLLAGKRYRGIVLGIRLQNPLNASLRGRMASEQSGAAALLAAKSTRHPTTETRNPDPGTQNQRNPHRIPTP